MMDEKTNCITLYKYKDPEEGTYTVLVEVRWIDSEDNANACLDIFEDFIKSLPNYAGPAQ